jgi:hypothetical protein
LIFVCSRKRRHSLSRFLHLSRPHLPGRILIDEDDDSYDGMELPPGWRFFMGRRDSTVRILNRAFDHFKYEPFYAVVCDDMIYVTKGWDKILAQSCEDRYVAWGSDGRWNDQLCTSFFLGGELARKMGWIVHPAFGHLFADRAWWEIAQRARLARYHPEVRFEHHKIADRTFFERKITGDRERFGTLMEGEIHQLVERARNAGGSDLAPKEKVAALASPAKTGSGTRLQAIPQGTDQAERAPLPGPGAGV